MSFHTVLHLLSTCVRRRDQAASGSRKYPQNLHFVLTFFCRSKVRYYVEQGKRPFFFTRERTEDEKVVFAANCTEELQPGTRSSLPTETLIYWSVLLMSLFQTLGGCGCLGWGEGKPYTGWVRLKISTQIKAARQGYTALRTGFAMTD